MDLASCLRLLLKTQYFFTVLLCNSYKKFHANKEMYGKKELKAIKGANVWCSQVGEGQWVLDTRYSFDVWGPDRFFCQSWDILRMDLCWSSLEIFSWLNSLWLGQNCSSLLGLELWVQAEREMASGAAPGSVMGRVTEDRGKNYMVGVSCFPGWHAVQRLKGLATAGVGTESKSGRHQHCSLTQSNIWVIWSKLPLLHDISFIKATLWLEIKVCILDNSQQQFRSYITPLKPKPVIFLYRLYTEMIKSLLEHEKLN